MVSPVRVFTKNCMMLRNLYRFSRNKRHTFSLYKVKKRNGVEGKGCYSSVVMAVGRGIFCFANLLLFPAVFRLYNTFIISYSQRIVRSVCVTASAVFSPAFSEIFTVQREIVFSHVEKAIVLGIVLFFQTHPPARILWRAHTLPH